MYVQLAISFKKRVFLDDNDYKNDEIMSIVAVVYWQ